MILGVVGVSSIFGLVRGAGTVTVVFPTFVLVSRMDHVEQYIPDDHFLSVSSSSRHEGMVGVTLTTTSTKYRFGCQWDYHHVWIV